MCVCFSMSRHTRERDGPSSEATAKHLRAFQIQGHKISVSEPSTQHVAPGCNLTHIQGYTRISQYLVRLAVPPKTHHPEEPPQRHLSNDTLKAV